MRIPEKLQMPLLPLTYGFSDYELDPEKSSVGAAFYNARQEHSERALKGARSRMKDRNFHEFSEKERKAFQTEYEKILRTEIDKALQEAILANGGVVKSFPVSEFTTTVTYSQTSYQREAEPEYLSACDEAKNNWEEVDYKAHQFDIYFDYFRGVEDENSIPYTSYYSNPTAEKLVRKEAELKERMTRVLNRGKERMKKFLGKLPALLAIGLDILLVWSAFGNRELYLSLSRSIPYYEFCSRYGSGLSFVHLIGMPIIGLILSAFLNIMLDPVVIRGISKRQAIADYESFTESSEYLNAKNALDEEKPRYEQLMKDFYTAWYRHCKHI